ncbi:Low affinity ammonium transporter [Exophiala dermatitidis]
MSDEKGDSSSYTPSQQVRQSTPTPPPVESESRDAARWEKNETVGPPPLSKAAKMALVATLACAGFLNVRTSFYEETDLAAHLHQIASVQSSVILLPNISRDLNIPPGRQQWVTSAYNIALGCALLCWGRMADIYGRRRIFLAGMAFITVVTIAIPFSPNEVAFDILRALQGLGASATTPSAVGILGATLPAGKQKNYGFIAYTAASSLGSVLGNILGGLIGSFLTWKWMFWITAIFAAGVGVAAVFVIPRTPKTKRIGIGDTGDKGDRGDDGSGSGRVEPNKQSLDIVGAIKITTGLVLLLFVLSEGNTVGWATAWIPVLLVLSILLIILFGFWQWHLEKKRSSTHTPLVRVSLFKNLQFTAAFVVIMTYFSSFNSYLVFATFFYQDYLGLSALATTLRFLPTGIAGFLICFVTARLMHITPGFYLLLIASCCGIISPLLFAVPIPPSTTYWVYGFPAMCLCISTDILAPTINLFIIRQLPPSDQALGGALIQTSNQLGRAIGLAISTAVETAIVKDHDRAGDALLLRGIRAGEWVNVGMAALASSIIILVFRDLKEVGAAIIQK